MADMSEAQWATLVIQNLGAPVTQNNLNNMLAWMASENSWPPPRNNPLNNGLGSGGGSGLGSYSSLEVAAQYAAKGMQGGITGAAGIGAALVADAPFSTFHAATVSATWSGDHYAGTDWLGASSPATMGVSGANAAAGNPALTGLAGMSAADQASFRAAIANPAVAQYFSQFANAGAQPSSTQAAGNAGSLSDTAGGLADVIASVLQPYGLDTPAIRAWAGNAVTQFASQGMTSAEIATQMGVELQEPQISTTDGGLAAAQRQFQALYPGLAQRNAKGLPPMTVAQYQSYTDNAYQLAVAAGISTGPGGLMNTKTIGDLIGHDVSALELGDRINKGYQAATQANPETLRLLQQYYPGIFPHGVNGKGPTNGQLVAYYLNPAITQATLDNQITAAQIGTEGVNSEFGGIPVAQAQMLQQAGVTQQTARDTFKSIAKLTPFEQQLPGVPRQGTTMTQAELVNYGFFGANQQELENVQSARKAPFTGGGGYAATSRGVVGAGSASTEGQQGT